MAGMKSFLQMLGFTSGEDEEMNNEDRYENEADDEEDDEDEEEEETQGGGFGFPFSFSFFSRKNRDDEDDEDEEDEQEDEEDAAQEESHRRTQSRQQSRSGRVIDYNKKSKERKGEEMSGDAGKHCEHIVVVRQLGDSRSIITHLHNGDSVILNLENIDPKDCGRVIDLLSGAAFALGGNIIKVSRLTYLLAPSSVKVVPPQSAPTANRYTM